MGGRKFTEPEEVAKGPVMRILRFISTNIAPGFFLALGLLLLATGLNPQIGLMLALVGFTTFFLLPLLDFVVLHGDCPYCFKELVVPCLVFGRRVLRCFGNTCRNCSNEVQVVDRKFWRSRALEQERDGTTG